MRETLTFTSELYETHDPAVGVMATRSVLRETWSLRRLNGHPRAAQRCVEAYRMVAGVLVLVLRDDFDHPNDSALLDQGLVEVREVTRDECQKGT